MMLASMWFMSIVTLLVMDVRIGALPQKDTPLRRCHYCAANSTACTGAAVTIKECAEDQPLCATAAASPHFKSELTCAAATTNSCSLTRTTDAFNLICTCAEDLCNEPFSKDIQKQLLDYTSSNITKHNSTDYTQAFFKLHFTNVTEEKMYKTITAKAGLIIEKVEHSTPHPISLSTVANTRTPVIHLPEEGLPRAEAFKHEPTALSEDDEDAGEGSGSYEETRTQRQPSSDPADPSSFLPANENKASPLAGTFLVITSVLFYIVS